MNIDDGGGRSSRRRNTESAQQCLPDDLIRIILLCLPADVLYNVMKFVCRDWYNIIQSPSFISSHLKNSPTGFLYYRNSKYYILKPTSTLEHGCSVEVKELNFKCIDKIRASCNGLVLVVGPKYHNSHWSSYVANLVTKQYLPLPLNPGHNCSGSWYLAYAAASRLYKVFYSGKKRQLILTVGVDKGWRKVDMSQLTSSSEQLSKIYAISMGGYLYWIQSRPVPFILCFDMENETFRQQLHLPPLLNNNNILYQITNGLAFAMGNSVNNVNSDSFEFWLLKDLKTGHGQWERLPDIAQFPSNGGYCHVFTIGSSLCLVKKVEIYTYEFWLLKDLQTGHGQGQWDRLSDISKSLRSCQDKMFYPFGWLGNGELLVLCALEGVILYNVNTRELHKPEELKMNLKFCRAHVESLVPMNNLSLMTTGRPRKISMSTSKIYSKDNMRAEFEERN